MANNFRKINENYSLFESIISVYRKKILSIYDNVSIDLFLLDDNIKKIETDIIDTYGLLAIRHYTKFIDNNNDLEEKFKVFGKILLKSIKVSLSIEYELPSWVIQN
jgi:hypothetical protein